MDEHQFMDRVDGLLESVRERLERKSVSFLSGAARAGEHGLVLDELAAELRGRRVPVTPAEAAELRELLFHFELPVDMLDSINDREGVLASLNVVRQG